MIVAIPTDGVAVAAEVAFHLDSIVKPALDLQLQQDAADLLVSPRCPLCRAPLVARLTRQGPQFLCLCDEARLHTAGLAKAPKLCDAQGVQAAVSAEEQACLP